MTAALIIAAGKTSSKNAFAPLKIVGSITAAQRMISIFRRAGIERIVLVCGENEQKAEKLASRMNVVCLRIADGGEMLDGVKTGLEYLLDKCESALISPVDFSLFTVETVQTMVASRAKIAIPAYGGRTGHPLLLHAEYFRQVLQYKGDGGLFAAIKNLDYTEIDVSDEGILVDTQRTDEVDMLISRHSLRKLHPDIRIRIVREKVFFDPLAQQLLLMTEETGNVREACQRMGISYSKGWNLLSLMEAQLGVAVVERQQGGKTGGHSSLTPEGRELLCRYSSFCDELMSAAEDLFKNHFGEWLSDYSV